MLRYSTWVLYEVVRTAVTVVAPHLMAGKEHPERLAHSVDGCTDLYELA